MEWRIKLDDSELTLRCLKSRGEVAVGLEHKLAYAFDDTKIRIAYDAEGPSVKTFVTDFLEKKGEAKRGEIVEAAAATFPDIERRNLEQQIKRHLRGLSHLGKVAHLGQGQPYRWLS